MALRHQIVAHMACTEGARIDQLEAALVPFDAVDVQAVACELVCLGLLTFNWDAELTRFSVLREVSP